MSEKVREQGEVIVELRGGLRSLQGVAEKMEGVASENESIKRSLWKLENDLREKEVKVAHGEKEIQSLKGKMHGAYPPGGGGTHHK